MGNNNPKSIPYVRHRVSIEIEKITKLTMVGNIIKISLEA